MGDHFVLLMNRLLTESTLEAAIDAIESRNRSKDDIPPAISDTEDNSSYHKIDFDDLSPRKLVECRICQDDDFDSNMETPCSCRGSLKYAHRRCVQRWCNEKGNTVCEICHQQFKPGYTAPPPLFQFGGIPMNFRGNWEISRRGLGNPHLIAMVSTNRNFLDPEYDEYAASASRSLMYCRSFAVIFTMLLIIRHTLPIIANGSHYSFSMFLLQVLRTAGIILPIYAMMRVAGAIHRRRRQQEVPDSSTSSSDEETEQPIVQHQAHVIHIR